MMQRKTKIFRISAKQKGTVLLYLVMAVVPVMAVLGLVIDYGSAVVCRTQMQKAVDAAALAGAALIPLDSAHGQAKDIAGNNYSAYDDVVLTVGSDTVTVAMSRDVPTYFMKIFGRNSVAVSVSATAIKPGPVGSLTGYMMPFCIINPNTNNDPADDLENWRWGKRYILQFGDDNLVIQDWANGDLPVGEDAPDIPEDYSKNNSEGWRSALGMDMTGFGLGDIGGADAFMYSFEHGYPGIISVGDLVPTETGNMVGGIMEPRANRLLGEEDYLFENFDPIRDYLMGRVIHVPIVSLLRENSTTERYTIDDYYAGEDWEHKQVIVDGFAPFYLLTYEEMGDVDGDGKAKDKSWIVGKFVPGTRTPTHSDGGGDSDFGMKTIPKLID